MKPAPFDYAAPRSLEEALGLLGEEVTPLAGGQSLVPLLNLRLARPTLILDLNRIPELSYLDADAGMTALRIGALVRQAALERSESVARGWPLLAQAVRFAGHPQTRSRGTVGGSVAHADPAAELPAALLAMDARVHLGSASAARIVPVADFFRGPFTTALDPDELLVEVEVPAMPAGAGTAFAEYSRTHGDFATAGAAVVLAPPAPADGGAAISVLGVGGVPRRAPAAEAALAAGATFREAAALAGSIAGDDDYRRALLTDLVRRALEQAAGRMGGDGAP
jgi:CO/xanthine dehydrogenase FAD-binding subunit